MVVQLSLIIRNIPSDDLHMGARPSSHDHFHQVSATPETLYGGS